MRHTGRGIDSQLSIIILLLVLSWFHLRAVAVAKASFESTKESLYAGNNLTNHQQALEMTNIT